MDSYDPSAWSGDQGFDDRLLAVETTVGTAVLAGRLTIDRAETRPALIQLTPPPLGVALLAAGLAS